MMQKETECCRCKKFGKVTWANYNPYCSKCLAEKSNGAIPFEDAVFPELKTERTTDKINKRLDKLEKETENKVRKIVNKILDERDDKKRK